MATRVQTLPARKPKFRAARPHDYLYDNTYVLSCPRDLQRCEDQALMDQPKVELRPNFRSMFSDHPRYPRLRMCLRCPDQGPTVQTSWESKQSSTQTLQRDVTGSDRHLFFRRPVAPLLTPVMPPMRVVSPPQDASRVPPLGARTVCCMPPPMSSRRRGPCSPRNVGTQTDYRESEAQTVPWEPPHSLGPDQQPEVLTLAALAYGNGLPAGWLEVDLIERMRVRRAWEAQMRPPRDETEEEKWRRAFTRLDRDQWLLREREIEANHRERLRLAKLLMEERQHLSERRLDARLARAWARGERQRDKKIGRIRMQRDRELRKLAEQHRGVTRRYKRLGPIEAHADVTSALYGPLTRFGADPSLRHEVIDVPCAPDLRLQGLEMLEQMPPEVEPDFDYRHKSLPPKEYILCTRETRWTEEALEKLLAELKGLREAPPPGGLGLVRRIYQESSPPSTPSQEGVSDEDEMIYQASVFLQKIIKGRAVQCLMFQGLRRCRELILELRSTHGLDERKRKMVQEQRTRVLDMEEQEHLAKFEEGRLAGLVQQLMGGTLGSMLDFLNKELTRLQDERLAHAFAMLAERARQEREAAEAGRRQVEERRRREHDEMFRQVVKVHQEAVDVYLEDVILKTLERTADEEARRYVRFMVKRIDMAADEASRRQDAIANDELVAELLHSFLLPEVEKRRLRERHLAKQRNLLRAAHDEVFGRLLKVRPEGAHLPLVPEPKTVEFFPEAPVWRERMPEAGSVAERLSERPPDVACWQEPDSFGEEEEERLPPAPAEAKARPSFFGEEEEEGDERFPYTRSQRHVPVPSRVSLSTASSTSFSSKESGATTSVTEGEGAAEEEEKSTDLSSLETPPTAGGEEDEEARIENLDADEVMRQMLEELQDVSTEKAN